MLIEGCIFETSRHLLKVYSGVNLQSLFNASNTTVFEQDPSFKDTKRFVIHSNC